MSTIDYKYWQDNNMWLGYLVEYPDYMTQGETQQDLKDHLLDIFNDLSNDLIPNIRRVGELEII